MSLVSSWCGGNFPLGMFSLLLKQIQLFFGYYQLCRQLSQKHHQWTSFFLILHFIWTSPLFGLSLDGEQTLVTCLNICVPTLWLDLRQKKHFFTDFFFRINVILRAVGLVWYLWWFIGPDAKTSCWLKLEAAHLSLMILDFCVWSLESLGFLTAVHCVSAWHPELLFSFASNGFNRLSVAECVCMMRCHHFTGLPR